MSTWTSRRRAPALAAIAAGKLPGAVRGAALASGLACLSVLGTTAATAQSAPERVAVASGAVVIAGPSGYCIDRAAARDDGERAFVLLGDCAVLSGRAAKGPPKAAGLLTASVLAGGFAGGEPIGAVMSEIARFMSSGPGRAALSRAGRAETVQVSEMRQSPDTLYLRISDRAPMPGAEVEPEYWRAILSIRGRIVTLSVLGLASDPMSSTEKRRILDTFVQRVRRASGSPQGGG